MRVEGETGTLSHVSWTQAALTSAQAQASTEPLTLQDLQYYHQFLMVAYPALPLRGQSLWFDAAAMSFQYQYLAHAVLALGASHLTLAGLGDHSAAALRHRAVTMKLVNEKLDHLGILEGQSQHHYLQHKHHSTTIQLSESAQHISTLQPAALDLTPIKDGDALFATLVILSAQAGLMPDAMTEYLRLVRGIEMVGRTVIPGVDLERSVFATWSNEFPADHGFLEQPLDHGLIGAFRRSAIMLHSLCQTTVEVEYVALLLNVVPVLDASSLDGT